MSVIPLTIFFSLLLVGGFVAFFIREQRQRRFASAERDSLLPLAEETPLLAPESSVHDHEDDHAHAGEEPGQAHDEDAHAHDHGHHHPKGRGGCGCRDGLRPPCAGCVRRTTSTAPAPAPAPANTSLP